MNRDNKRNPVYIIAEAGVNHNGCMETAKNLVDVAADAGADAVKFQTFRADQVISRYAPKAAYQRDRTGDVETQLEMVKRLEFGKADHFALVEHCRSKGIRFLSTPFDNDSLNLLADTLDLPCLKIGSGDLNNAPFLLKAAATGKDIILSTGMATLGEVEEALGVLASGYMKGGADASRQCFRVAFSSEAGQRLLKEKVKLLHCTTEYPAPYDEVNLMVLETMRRAFALPVGLSDHTMGTSISIAAAALGASIIEKHFTLNKNLPGPDHKASLEPHELRDLVKAIRQVECAMGTSVKLPTKSEFMNRDAARRSLVASRPIKKGDVYSVDNVSIKRPGTGISPMYYWDLLGQKANKHYHEDELITQ